LDSWNSINAVAGVATAVRILQFDTENSQAQVVACNSRAASSIGVRVVEFSHHDSVDAVTNVLFLGKWSGHGHGEDDCKDENNCCTHFDFC
jgi:hypothetical protein